MFSQDDRHLSIGEQARTAESAESHGRLRPVTPRGKHCCGRRDRNDGG
jgi:hypothetical protein